MLTDSVVRPTQSRSQERFTPIDVRGHVSLLAAGCQALRSGTDTCTRCMTACPAGCLHFSSDSLRADETCLACGRCAAACPTGALQIRGFAHQEPLPDGNAVRVECLKVPISIAGHKAIRVPCLGGLSPAGWLRIVESADGRPVEVIRRGWCAQCSAGDNDPTTHPAASALEQLAPPLDELGWAAERRPRFRDEPLPPSLMPVEIPREGPESLARRALFRQLGQEVQRAVGTAEAAGATSPRDLMHLAPRMPERTNLIATLRRLANASHRPMPSAPFASIDVTSDCCNHQLCARLCPTGALTDYEEGGTTGLSFDPNACTRCGRCANVCPENALRLRAASTAPTAAIRIRVSAFSERLCARCRAPFAGGNSQTECPACSRSRHLGHALFGLGTPLADSSLKAADAVSHSGGVHHE